MLRLVFATGTEPGKWFRRYRDVHGESALHTVDADDALAALLEGQVDLALARVPLGVGDHRIDDSYHVVRLYEEEPGIAVPKESVYAEVGEPVELEDVAEEHLNYRIGDDGLVDVPAVRQGLQVVAANVGIVIAPRPLLKVLSKKLVVPLGLVDPTVARTEIALVWPKAGDSEEIQDFVGVAKGRTKNSSRSSAGKISAREKTKAKQERRAKAAVKGSERSQARKGSERSQQSNRNASHRPKNKTLSKRNKGFKRGKRR
ncbi:LysR family transcriptional regulator substrate-binding protein [Corynebacterium sp.]|uniref:LysR family transcriptional regulator substrate-binding protein n=1 Tax=Corynebacterium sp. TaxID=1720 RepID=UPI0026DD843A|nr:LysR family transcriptional regulator substrate-binding protein [Corynebacterium sp.]MDO5032813.1 LysR family transcriptional regulator substrate-binding protein [Corynebacterium sp.]